MADLLSDLPPNDEPSTGDAPEALSEPASGLGTDVLETAPEASSEGVPVPAEFRQDSGFLDPEDKSKAANPEGFAAVLTVALRPQWELNPCSRRERPVS